MISQVSKQRVKVCFVFSGETSIKYFYVFFVSSIKMYQVSSSFVASLQPQYLGRMCMFLP